MSREQRLGLRGGLGGGPIRIGLPADVTDHEDDTPRPTSRPKPRKVGSTVNTLIADDEEPAADRHTAARPTPPVEVETMAKTATPKSEVKAPVPAAEATKVRVRKSRVKVKVEPVTVTVPPVAPPIVPVAQVPAPPPGYVPPEEVKHLCVADVYSALVQYRLNVIANAVAVSVVLVLAILVLLVAGPFVALFASIIACCFGLGVQKAVKFGLNKYLSIGLLAKSVSLVFVGSAAALSMMIGLWPIGVPLTLLLAFSAGLQGIVLEYRVAQIGTGELQVLESVAPEPVGVGGFEAPSVPAASRMPTDGDAA